MKQRTIYKTNIVHTVLLACTLLSGLCAQATAAETDIHSGVKGLWTDSGPGKTATEPWQAQWIWMHDDVESNMMLARRTFDFSSRPETARLRITATSLYKLWVNGEYVSRGPARCAPHHQSYDEFEIARLLHEGANTLAVRVHYQEGTISYHHCGRPGLLAQLDVSVGGEARTISTDSSWKVYPDPAWDDAAPRMSRFHLEVCDRVDLRQQIQDWHSAYFDEATWPSATPLLRNVGWPSPQPNSRPLALTPPWTALERRDIPYLTERDVPAAKLIEAVPIAGKRLGQAEVAGMRTINHVVLSGKIDPRVEPSLEPFLANDSPLEVPPADSASGWFFLFDFGTILNGMPQLDIDGPAGTIVDVMCAPFVVDEAFSANVVDSQFIDRIVLSGRRNQWQATYFKPARYLGIAIRGAESSVKLHSAAIHQVAYPFEILGSLSTPENPWLEACWDAAAKTIEVCTTDAYTDNYRERRQYVQTGYYAALGNYWTFGDTALQRRYLKQAAEEQQANGMMPAYAPRFGDDFMVILDSNTACIRGLRNYLLFSGDEDTVRELLPAGRRLMALLADYTNSLGLLDNPPYAYWLDHAVNDRRGANFCMNGHYLGALEDFADVLDWLNETGADVHRARADTLRDSLRKHFWNPEWRLFCDALVDGQQSDMFSEHANAMALAMQVATREQARAIAGQLLDDDAHNYIQRASGMTMVTPAMSYFLHAGLCQYGYVAESLDMLRNRFDRMLQPDTNQTLWEEWWRDGTGRTGRLVKGRTRSDAQTESAFPPALFGEYVLGLRPLSPGLKDILLFRPVSGMSRMGGTMPTSQGKLEVTWNLAAGDLQVSVPAGMRVHLDLDSFEEAGSTIRTVDGQTWNEPVGTHNSTTLSEGLHHVTF